MIKKITQILAIVSAQVSLIGALALVSPLPASALFENSVKQACSGAQLKDGSAGDTCTSGATKIEGVVKVALDILSITAGVAAVIMIIIAGIRYITSGGDSSGVSGAKNTIIYAIVGIAVVVLSQLIVRFVINRIR